MSRILRAHRAQLNRMSAIIAAPAIIHTAAYANTLTALLPSLYDGLHVVSRELVGFISAAYRNTSAERAAVGQDIIYPIAPKATLFNVTPAMAIPEPADKVFTNGIIKITKSQGTEFGWTGEEQLGLSHGPGYISLQSQLFAEGLRTLVNAIELDLAICASANASRSYGTAGTTPFATTVGDSAQVKKMLDDNGAPADGRALIIDTTAGAALRTLGNLTKANEAGTTMTLRDGVLLDLNGLAIKESAQVQTAPASTAASATTNTAGYAVGSTVIGLASAGTGAIIAGSSVSFAGDANKYKVVAAGGDADVSNGGSITIASPGLMRALPASAVAITAVAAHVSNIGFANGGLHLICRAPALPQGGDAAIDRRLITDVRSGMTFEVALYAGYRKIRAEITAAWGVGAPNPDYIVELMG